MAFEQSHVPKQLVLAREARAARALPPRLSAMLEVVLQVRHNRKALLVAAITRVHLRTVASLEVVLHANDRFQRPEFLVRLVAVATVVRAREFRVPAQLGGGGGASEEPVRLG